MSNVSRRNFFQGRRCRCPGCCHRRLTFGLRKRLKQRVHQDATTQRPSTPSWLGEAPQIDEAEITETLD